MRTNTLPRLSAALVLAVSLALSPAFTAFAASDDGLDYYVGGVSENGYLVDDDDNYIDFDEAVCGPAADSDLRVPYGKTIYFPLLNTGTSGDFDSARRALDKAKDKLREEEIKFADLEEAAEKAKERFEQLSSSSGSASSTEVSKAKAAIKLLQKLHDTRQDLIDWEAGYIDSGNLKSLISSYVSKLEHDYNIDLLENAPLEEITNEIKLQQAIIDNAASSDQAGNDLFEAWQKADKALDAQRAVVQNAQNDVDKAQRELDNATGGTGDGYPFVHESQAVRHIKIKTDWDEGKSYIDSLSITKKRYKHSPYAAPSGAKRYAYFLAIEIKDRDSTSTSTRDVSGTVKLKKTSGSHPFTYDDVQVDVDFEIGFNPPEDTNVIPIEPALFEPDEDFDQDSDEEFEFEADDDSYYIANTKNQKKIVLGLDTDYDDEIGDRYEYASLSFWNGNGATFNRSGYLYLYADEDDYLYAIDDDGDLKLLSPDYDRYEDCFVVRTRTLGRYVVSDRKLREVTRTTEDSEPDVTVVYDVDTGVNYNPTTGGYGADDDEAWNAPTPADTTVFSRVLTRDGMLAKPGGSPAETPAAPSREEGQALSAAPTAALTGENPLAPPAPEAPAGEQGRPLGRNAVILFCILAAEVTVALTSLACYFAFFRKKHN